MAFVDEKAATSEEEFVRHGQADDAEHQQAEDREIAIGGDPMKDGGFHLVRIADVNTLP